MNPVSMYLADVFTVPSNIADVPTISVPSGTVEREGKNLPLGIQFFGPGCREDLVFEVSKKFLGESES
jgi:aspartyl-tRNA(Asn)/glutamyl-tRNA(Gln) amidotransferase subunit A